MHLRNVTYAIFHLLDCRCRSMNMLTGIAIPEDPFTPSNKLPDWKLMFSMPKSHIFLSCPIRTNIVCPKFKPHNIWKEGKILYTLIKKLFSGPHFLEVLSQNY